MTTPKQAPQTRFTDSAQNPCLKEYDIALKCKTYARDQGECEQFFENYRECKKFWGKIIFDRRRKGVVPDVPTLEEQAEIKARLQAQVQS